MASRVFLLLLVTLAWCGARVVDGQCLLPPGSPNVQIVGRSLPGGAVVQFDWSAIQVSAIVTGTSAISVNLQDYGNYWDVLVDGNLVQTFAASASQTSYFLANLDGYP